MPELTEHLRHAGFLDGFLEGYENEDPDWVNTYGMAKDTQALDPQTIPNTYFKYYLYQDEVVQHTDPNYTRTDMVKANREKNVFETCQRIIDAGSAKDGGFEPDVHAEYIIDLACAIAFNTRTKMNLIVPNDGIIPNFDQDAMVEVPCYVTNEGYEAIPQKEIPTFQRGLMFQQHAVEKLVVQA